MTDIKARLLSPNRKPVSVSILGGKFFIRRLSAQEQVDFEAQTEKFREQNDPRGMALMSAATVLGALVDANGTPFAELPTPEELIDIHSHADLLEAVSAVQRHSFGTLEDAEKN